MAAISNCTLITLYVQFMCGSSAVQIIIIIIIDVVFLIIIISKLLQFLWGCRAVQKQKSFLLDSGGAGARLVLAVRLVTLK